MGKTEKVALYSLPNKMGVSMAKVEYTRIADFIMFTLERQQRKRINLHDLLDKARKELDKEFNGNVSWYLLHVKNDMVVRGLINIVFTIQRQQLIVKGPSRTTGRRRRNQLT